MDSLIEILALLKSQTGHVQIVDRETNARTFDGSVEEVRDALVRRLAASGIQVSDGHGIATGEFRKPAPASSPGAGRGDVNPVFYLCSMGDRLDGKA